MNNEFVIEKGVLKKYKGGGGDVTIPEGVTSIGSWAFYGCSGLISMTIPEGVTSIGSLAFYECNHLTSVTIPESVTSIEDSAFARCSRMTSVTIPKNVPRIGKRTFKECRKLADKDGFVIVNAILFDYRDSFRRSKKNAVIPESVKIIGDSAFEGCTSLTGVIIPEGVTIIGNSAFERCSLASVTIPDSVRSIGYRAFNRCTNLTNVTIMQRVNSSAESMLLEKNLFRDSKSMKSLFAPNIPLSRLQSEGFGMMAARAFIENHDRYEDPSIRAEYISYISSQRKKLMPDILSRDSVEIIMLLAKAKKITKKNLEKDYLLPAMQCKAQKCIEFLGNLFEEEANGKKSKESLDISGRELWDGVHFSIDGRKLLKYEEKDGQREYHVPEGTREIVSLAFDSTELERIYLPESVEILRDEAFVAKEDTTICVYFPRSLKYLSNKALSDCWYSDKSACYAFISTREIAETFCARNYNRFVHCVYTGGPLGDIINYLKPYAVQGFLYADQNQPETVGKWRGSYLDHIKRNEKTYIKQVLEKDKDSVSDYLLKLMLEEKLLSRKGTKSMLEKAIEGKKSELVAALMDYQKTQFGEESNRDTLSLSDDDPDIKRRLKMAARREQIKGKKGIEGIVFVATGDFENFGWSSVYSNAKDMSDLKEFIELRGGFLRNAVSSKTDYLICNDANINTKKCNKAKELQVPFITEEEFLKMADETE